MDKLAVMVALSTVFIPLVWSQNYCSISQEHTMCKYKGTGPSCNGEVFHRGVTDQEKEEIMTTHNKLRAKIARGEEKRGKPGPQPPAANMRKLEWDDELATIAQRHADQCTFAHDCSDCRMVQRFGVGQNLYIYKQSLRAPKTQWKKAVTDWYDEVALFSNKKVEPFQFAANIGHYSQLVWAETNKVGCGATSYKDGRWFATLYTCNYGPNGNFIRAQMYKKGSACSDCPSSQSCSVQFPGLCESSSGISFTPVQSLPSPSLGSPLITSTPNRFTPPQKTPAAQTTARTTTQRTTTRRPTRRPTTTRPTTRRPTTRRPTTRRPTTRRPTTRRPTTRRPTTRRPTTRRPTTRRPTTRRPTTARTTTLRTTTAIYERESIRPETTNSTLIYCSFQTPQKECDIRSAGVKWRKEETRFDGVPNQFYAARMSRGDKTEMFFENLIKPPRSGVACLDFRYKKFSPGESTALSVLAWPFKGKPGRVNILRDSPDGKTWIRAQVTFRNIENHFLIMLKSSGPSGLLGRLYLAVDDVTVTEGSCSTNL